MTIKTKNYKFPIELKFNNKFKEFQSENIKPIKVCEINQLKLLERPLNIYFINIIPIFSHVIPMRFSFKLNKKASNGFFIVFESVTLWCLK